MALTASQKQFIVQLDNQAKQILQHGNEEALLMTICNKMNKIKDLLDSAKNNELNLYCEQYDGFYRYMNLLERLAIGTSQGIFDDIIK